MSKEEKCCAGCKMYYGGEIKHHKDCVFYPESLTSVYDAIATENAQLKEALRETSNELNQVFMDWYPYDDDVEIHRIGGIIDKAKQLLTEKEKEEQG